MKFIQLALLCLLALVVFAACADETPVEVSDAPTAVDVNQYLTPGSRAIEADLAALAIHDPAAGAARGFELFKKTGSAQAVIVPAGSVDAMASAIAAAGPGGTVRVASGLHTESGSVVITHPVRILGEAGAVLEVSTQPWPDVIEVDAAFHILEANNDTGRRVTISGLEIRPAAGTSGGWGFLIENTARVAIAYNTIVDHQGGVILEQADNARVLGNTIALDPSISEHGVVVINGDKVGVSGNTVTGAVFGLWACDEDGLAIGNDFSSSIIGLIYCKVPFSGYVMPDGTVTGSQHPATRWLSVLNHSSNNAWGYMLVDGANNSALVANDAQDNAFYDVHVVPDTEALFGFCTPSAVDNTVVTTDDADVIKDCGIGTLVIGGTLVDLSQDPCEPPCTGGARAALTGSPHRAALEQALEQLGH